MKTTDSNVQWNVGGVFGFGVRIALAACLLHSQAFGAPQGEQVVSGSAEFTRSGDLTLIEAGNNRR